MVNQITVRLLLLAVLISSVCCSCTMEDEECVFYFDVSDKLTMSDNISFVYPNNGTLYRVGDVDRADPVPFDNVVTADGGAPERVLVVNGTLPGPSIIVYEGQTIVVHVKNSLLSEVTTIHWHGMHQVGTPWMDGVPYVSQCPILPRQTFTYKFKLAQTGTYWWHSHAGAQRSKGLYGAFIVRVRQSNAYREHIMQVSDWGHKYVTKSLFDENNSYDFGGEEELYDISSSLYDRKYSGLINGRGRLYNATGASNMAPLTVYPVKEGRKYRFRVIGVAEEYSFRISVDDHRLAMLASDGYDFEPVFAESFIINPGERYDFELSADQPVGNYWIRAVSAERDFGSLRADAILRYIGAPDEDPTTSRQRCTRNKPCVILDCPYTSFPEPNTLCLSFNNLRASAINDSAPPYIEGKFQEFFLNFGFPGGTASVNGRTFDTPDVNPLFQPTEWYSPCSEPECGSQKICKCTYSLDIGFNDTIQMVFTNMGAGKGKSHPIHMHGHSFYVLKMGYGIYNETTGRAANNPDVDCRGSYCNDATWSDILWNDGNIPDLELERPPRKDTIIVPEGGYVVLRIRANNPGIWNMHCHLEPHNLLGMRLLLNESFSEVPASPAYFPTCNSYPHKHPPPSDVSKPPGERGLFVHVG